MQPLSAALAMLHQSESETEGMSFMERAQYRAKMRRREQTRLRRENAKRGASSGGEGRNQAMSMMDMQFTLIRLIASAALVIAGLAAEGCTCVEQIQYIQRGYEDFEGKITNLGGIIKRVDSERELQKFRLKIG